MDGWTLVTALPLALLAAVVLFGLGRGARGLWRRRRHGTLTAPGGKSLYGRILLSLFFVGLFGLDFFLFLKRDGFRASWSLTFWMMLAAFMVGEMVGRWNSPHVPLDHDRPGPEA